MRKLAVAHEHRADDLAPIYLAVTSTPRRPADDAWIPAMRDRVDGRRVVWVRLPDGRRGGVVWLRDRDGARVVTPM